MAAKFITDLTEVFLVVAVWLNEDQRQYSFDCVVL